jgi:undecaprenyl-diphosphatase
MPSRISPSRTPGRGAGFQDTPGHDGASRLSIPQAVVLGALHGPTELLPISSSGHTSALPWLFGWSYSELDDELRKAFEVALHAGSAAAWLLVGSSPVREAVQAVRRDRRQGLLIGLASLPAGIAGLALERPIERRLGTPGSVAFGLLLGSLAMVIADRGPQDRDADGAGPGDALWLGVAQACGLLPGISRTGATLSAARLRGFGRSASWRLSARVAGPVIGGATVLKLARVTSGDLPPAAAGGLLAGGVTSFASSLLAWRVLRPLDSRWPLWPFAAYRSALGLAIALRRSRPDSIAPRSRTAAD